MDLPAKLLRNILWNFDQEKFGSQQDFETELLRYNELITDEKPKFDVSEIVYIQPKILIHYCYWSEEEDDDLEDDFLLESDNARDFNLGELLYKIHNRICENLKNDDHVFFEGLDLWKESHPHYPDVPLYFLLQGS